MENCAVDKGKDMVMGLESSGIEKQEKKMGVLWYVGGGLMIKPRTMKESDGE